MKKLSFLPLAIALAAFTSPASAEPDGEALYLQHCASCHGVELEGQPDWKTRKADGKLPAPPQDETGHSWHHSDKQLFAITKFGIEALVPDYKSDMAGFGGVMSDEEIWAVLDYIKSQWPESIRKKQAEMSSHSGG